MTDATARSEASPLEKAGERSDPAHDVYLRALGVLTIAAIPLLPIVWDNPEPVACHHLLTVRECLAYQRALATAPSSQARAEIKLNYRLLLQEREPACPCGATPEQSVRPAPARLSSLLDRGQI